MREWPKRFAVSIKMSFGFRTDFIFFAIFFARARTCDGSLSAVSKCSFGRMSVCPLEIGFSSRTASAFLFSPICADGIFPSAIEQKTHCCSDGEPASPDFTKLF